MDEELPVGDGDASRSPPPDTDVGSDVPGSTNSLDSSPDSHRNYNTSCAGHHQLGVAIDLPEDDEDDIGFE